MAFPTTSSLSWMDSSEHERRTMLELVSALNEPGTLDELGIGSVRDTIADSLFPGTSTIQTRARYFLFIPWILRSVEQGPARQAEIATRQLQLQLCNALSQAHGPNEGVIGREAGASLRRWPISIYWQGLAQWGIRRFVGSMTSYFSHLRQPSRWGILGRPFDEDAEDVREDTGDHVRGNWATLPPPSAGFPGSAVFALSPEEGQFLRERIALTHPQSYLAHLLNSAETSDFEHASMPWAHTAAHTASALIVNVLRDARLLGLVHQGAVLLFNLMLAEALAEEERADALSGNIATWSLAMQGEAHDLAVWDRTTMWSRLRLTNPRIRSRTIEFIEQWYAVATEAIRTSQPLQGLQEGRRLIRERERALKGTRARLSHAQARDLRRGYPTSDRLTFRWPQVRQIATDILGALE